MPTYEYVCEKCGHQFEKVHGMNDKPLTTCLKEACPRKVWGRGRVKKVISGGAGLIFKGTGFYITDYRSEKYKEAAKKDSGSGSGSGESKGEKAGGTEAKPAAKAESKPAKASKPTE